MATEYGRSPAGRAGRAGTEPASSLGHSATIPNAVVFLDFDGVICSPRAYVAQAARWDGEQRPLRWADQVACDLVAQLLRKHDAKLVISSTWRHMVDSCHKVLGRYGLTPFLHDDWRTGEDRERYRGREVAAWLEANGRPPFIILDDDSDMLPDQMPWLVNTCPHNGLMLADFEKADALLAQGIEAQRAATLGVVEDESPVGEADAPGDRQ